MFDTKIVFFACMLFIAITGSDAQGAEHPIVQKCAELGYEYGTCYDTLINIMNTKNPNRCNDPIQCVGSNSGFFARTIRYYVENVTTSMDGTICGNSPKGWLTCNSGRCDKLINSTIAYTEAKVDACNEYYELHLIES